MKPVRTAFSDAYFCETPQPSMRKLPLVARLAEQRGYAQLVAPEPVGREALETIHHSRYVESVMTGYGDLDSRPALASARSTGSLLWRRSTPSSRSW
jgi:hypothetical protein